MTGREGGMVAEIAAAKINWTLDVLHRRPDGYHEVDTLMQSTTLCDDITIEKARGGVSLCVTNMPELARLDPEKNLAVRAARALEHMTGRDLPCRIAVNKRIPQSAGLGGGSADAAAVLRGLNRLYGLKLSYDALRAAGLRLGADVPFCVSGGLARAGGVGQILRPLDHVPGGWLLIVKPCPGLSTADVFAAFRSQPGPRPDNDAAVGALINRDAAAFNRAMGNALYAAALSLRPEIALAVGRLYDLGADAAAMTGSGPCVFGWFLSREAADTAYRATGAYERWLCRPSGQEA